MPETKEDIAAKPESFELMLLISLTMTVSCVAIIFAFQEIEAFGRNLYLVTIVFVAASIIGGWTIIGGDQVARLLFKEAK
jgi:hypothetical protein